MNTSEQTNEIATALAKAQAVMTGAKKDATNPHFKSKYADLASCWDAIREAFPQQGLSIVQTTRPSEKDEVIVITRLAHTSGQWYEGELALPVSKADAQGYGSALTYGRRYGLCSIAGVAPDDDDGNLAAAAKPPKMGMSGAEVNREVLDGMTDEEKDFIRSVETEVRRLFATKGDLPVYLEGQRLGNEEKMALWALLPSDIRSEIKRQEAAKRKAA